MIKKGITLVLVFAALFFISSAASAQTKFTLNKEGVGCLKRGMLLSKVPAKCAGLYDKIDKQLIENEMDGDYTVYTFYMGTDKVAEIPDYGEGKIGYITVYSSNVSTADGVFPGMLIHKLLQIKGVKGVYQEAFNLELNDYAFSFDGLTKVGGKAFDDAYLKGTPVKLSNACFKADAKVLSIGY